MRIRQNIARSGVFALASLIPFACQAATPDTTPPLMTLLAFPGGVNGSNPEVGLTAGPSGAYFGTTYTGGTVDLGMVFELTPPVPPATTWTETPLYSFQGGTDGAYPKSALVAGPNNTFYGTTFYGGASGYGTVFQLTPPVPPATTWTETVLYSFLSGADGANPTGDLFVCATSTLCTVGAIFGTTTYGGAAGTGTVYELLPPTTGGWTEQQLYAFQTGTDGANPMTGLLMGTANSGASLALFGTTYNGGADGAGTVFELTPPSAGNTWVETLIYTFTGMTDGSSPASRVYPGAAGTLLGTTFFAGSSKACPLGGFVVGCGTAYQLTPPAKSGGAWTFKTIYTFTGNKKKGAHPSQGIASNTNGNIYVTTYSGGNTSDTCYGQNNYPGCGTIMQLTPTSSTWTPAVLHVFTGGTDGGSPNGVLIDATGTLYGTDSAGGKSEGYGIVFSMKP